MSPTTGGANVRAEWLQHVAAQCQLFIGDAVLLGEPDEVSHLAAGFSARLPAPASHVERLVLRALLIEVAVRWGALVHAQAHHGRTPWRCAFMATQTLNHVWDHAHENVTNAFLEWARAFSAELARAHPTSPAQRVLAMLRSPKGGPLSVTELANLVGVTPARLRRTFRLERGMALPKYLRRVRLVHALQTLADERGKIEPVALEVGYRSKKTFYRVFKQLTGMTPMQFRQLPAGPARQIIEDNKLSLRRGWWHPESFSGRGSKTVKAPNRKRRGRHTLEPGTVPSNCDPAEGAFALAERTSLSRISASTNDHRRQRTKKDESG